VKAMEGNEAFFIATGVINGEPAVLGFSTHRIDDAQDGASVYVRGEAVRQGIGTALLRVAEEHALARGASSIQIQASLAGVGFYKANGFEETGRGDALLLSGRSMPCVFMRKLLGQPGECRRELTPRAPLPVPKIRRMGYNPANFAYHMGTGPWVPGYAVWYSVSFYDATTGRESPRSQWWGPKSDPKQRYGGFGLIRIPVDPTGQATARRIWRRFAGEGGRLIHEIADNVTTTYQDDVL
jgi:GNAT superfamily N-acetyltransferase